jgi:hypothetical protein
VTDHALVSLDWPSDTDLRHVGTLVLGGVAARTELPVDRVEELTLAVDSLARAIGESRIQLEIEVASDKLDVSVGPFENDPLRDAGVDRVVRALVDGVEHRERDGASWISLVVLLPQE